MTPEALNRIVIVGGGTAGWMTAAALPSVLGKSGPSVHLIESEAIGIVGVGEATLPHIRYFNNKIGIDEADFMAFTHATFKLGIQFNNWGKIGDSYIHPFGDYGLRNDGVGFHHYWRKFMNHGQTGSFDEYSLPIVASKMAKFQMPSPDASSVLSTFGYAYQFDATRYAPYLRRHAEERGVKRTEGKVVDVQLRPEDGFIDMLVLESGERITGDLFIDCSGFFGVLIEKALKTGYDEWTSWLPCDRAVAAPCESHGPLLPYTKSTARQAGWQWRIPLQHRTGNGHVYSSNFIDDDAAEKCLRENLDGPLLADPRLLRFVTGKRKKLWHKNCVAIGLAGGFLEPLESTSIHLIQVGITNLIELLPTKECALVDRDEYNLIMDLEFERIRDFLILHYHATQRTDSPFWNYVRTMSIPSSLEEKIALFKARGRVASYTHGLFLEPSWLAVYFGQRIIPDGYDPRVDLVPDDQVVFHLNKMHTLMHKAAQSMTNHADAIARYCPSDAVLS